MMVNIGGDRKRDQMTDLRASRIRDAQRRLV
jgi:hypothetical protein